MAHRLRQLKGPTMKVLAVVLLTALAPLPCAAQAAHEPPLIVEDLRCRGNAATSCDFILGHVYVSPGDALDETELQNAKLRLATLRLFNSVDIYLEKGSDRGRAIVVVEVAEAEPVVGESLLGASSRLDAFRLVLAGRLTHQNLFGRGKTADVSVVTVQPINGPSHEDYSATIRYADPHLFGSKRYFAIASASYLDASSEDSYGNFGEAEVLRFGVTLGRRLWDFSYFTFGYGYRPLLDAHSGHWQSDGTFELNEDKNRHVVDFIYGWYSEDDLYFPTRGSSFHIGGGWNFGSDDEDNEFHLQFRKTWRLGDAHLSLKIGGDPNPEYRNSFNESQLLALTYARPVDRGDFVKRGRWYIEPGFNWAGFRPGGKEIQELGLKIGVRLETDALGLVDLYVIGTTDPGQ
jgi:outer membrane protein assembly factor BamA